LLIGVEWSVRWWLSDWVRGEIREIREIGEIREIREIA